MITADHTRIPESLVRGTEQGCWVPQNGRAEHPSSAMPCDAGALPLNSKSTEESSSVPCRLFFFFLILHPLLGLLYSFLTQMSFVKKLALNTFQVLCLQLMMQKHPQSANTSGNPGAAPTTPGDGLLPSHALQCRSS